MTLMIFISALGFRLNPSVECGHEYAYPGQLLRLLRTRYKRPSRSTAENCE
jgi:hypothetical protein